MSYAFLKTSILLALLGLFSSLSVVAQQRSNAPLTNASIVKLVRAGFKEKTVVAIIRSHQNQFNLEPDRLIELKRSGVSENIILFMLSQDDSGLFGGEDWADDSFSKDKGRSSSDPENAAPQPGGTDIFGSSGGSKSHTRTRGMNGANEAETTTTGSATVRILRPPSEASGAQLKLEKTPALNNDTIIKLVEAGFSEGTIVKRIEDSPAEFDLSAQKVEELRKRRVTEPIIAAMTAAMDDLDPKQPAPGRTREN
jgi:hypothetical protein